MLWLHSKSEMSSPPALAFYSCSSVFNCIYIISMIIVCMLLVISCFYDGYRSSLSALNILIFSTSALPVLVDDDSRPADLMPSSQSTQLVHVCLAKSIAKVARCNLRINDISWHDQLDHLSQMTSAPVALQVCLNKPANIILILKQSHVMLIICLRTSLYEVVLLIYRFIKDKINK